MENGWYKEKLGELNDSAYGEEPEEGDKKINTRVLKEGKNERFLQGFLKKKRSPR